VDLSSGALKKWFSLEVKGMHDGLVAKRKSLETLLKEDRPSAATRDKKEYIFEKEVLERIGKTLPKERHDDLMLPINIHIDMKIKDQCYVEDELAAEVLRKLEGFERAYRYRDGKMWLPLSLAAELLSKHKTAIQIVFLV
jgi:uncharacterized protein (UPF0216 family)